ncbi:protein transport protein SEC9 [Geosmithia morbida]|uniref:Protein transport protein SEC9 n=1 Tax=Geosmithia morbida TaxID=1094350 RepID=A0A9P4YYH6_9HYPO|nr:protein transport protein SEC9 [Geosmithia morbida]KAF4123329.1 protein transport protein SEC9 [Geosmithia morbida]
MKKFGFGKKGEEGEDANRGALFGRKKSSSSQSDNPYAKGGNDPYADPNYQKMTPYQKAKAGVEHGAPPGGPAGGSSYGGQPAQPSGYSASQYGSGGGYGSNRYEKSPAQDPYSSPAPGARGPGGYGGLGRLDSETDDNRDALFAGAQQRQAQRPDQGAPPPAYSQSGSGTAAEAGGYEGYGEQRELTAEEEEEQEYQAILAEKRKLQQESAGSVNRSVQMARQANEVAQATLARLGAQGERLQNTEQHLNMAANQNKIAQDRAAELKTLNRSMWAVHVSNPFTSKQRQQRADDEVMARHRAERAQREETRRDAYQANQRMEGNFKELNQTTAQMQRQRTGKKDYGKFNLDDEDDEARELEDQIDEGIDELGNQVRMMNMVGRAIGREVDAQNSQIERISAKSDAVDDQTRMNRERLARIK